MKNLEKGIILAVVLALVIGIAAFALSDECREAVARIRAQNGSAVKIPSEVAPYIGMPEEEVTHTKWGEADRTNTEWEDMGAGIRKRTVYYWYKDGKIIRTVTVSYTDEDGNAVPGYVSAMTDRTESRDRSSESPKGKYSDLAMPEAGMPEEDISSTRSGKYSHKKEDGDVTKYIWNAQERTGYIKITCYVMDGTVTNVYTIDYSDARSGGGYKAPSKRSAKKTVETYDPFHADEFSYGEDFYDEYYDEFDYLEDAEDYWIDHQ